MTDWRSHEPIPTHLGGGAIVKGPLGCLHLIGAAWGWWQCPTCEAAKRNHRRAAEVRELITKESA